MMTRPVDVSVGVGHRMPDPLPPVGCTCPRRQREHKHCVSAARPWTPRWDDRSRESVHGGRDGAPSPTAGMAAGIPIPPPGRSRSAAERRGSEALLRNLMSRFRARQRCLAARTPAGSWRAVGLYSARRLESLSLS